MSGDRARHSFIAEPRGDLYRSLLIGLSQIASTIGVVIRPWIELTREGEAALARLSALAIGDAEVNEWPGTQLLRGSARVVRLPASEEVADLMGKLAESLFAWQQPGLPEDVFFQRSDGSTLFGSVAHEGDAFLELSSDEEEVLTRAVPGLFEIMRLD